MRGMALLAAIGICFCVLSVAEAQTTRTVNPNLGCCPTSCTGTDYCTIQAAITASNIVSQGSGLGDIINVAAGVYVENLSYGQPLGELEIRGAGEGESGTIIDGSGVSSTSTFESFSTDLTMSDLTITGGTCPGGSQGGGLDFSGGTTGLLELTDVTFDGNTCNVDAGGLSLTSAIFTGTRVTFTGNS